MKYTTEMVIDKLRNYPTLRKKLSLLQYELNYPRRITKETMLQVMAQPVSGKESNGKTNNPGRDRMMEIVLSYEDRTAAMNEETDEAILQEWQIINEEVSRLDFYLSLLPEEERRILTLCYIERWTWTELEEKLSLSRRTIIRRREAALERMKDLLNYAASIVE